MYLKIDSTGCSKNPLLLNLQCNSNTTYKLLRLMRRFIRYTCKATEVHFYSTRTVHSSMRCEPISQSLSTRKLTDNGDNFCTVDNTHCEKSQAAASFFFVVLFAKKKTGNWKSIPTSTSSLRSVFMPLACMRTVFTVEKSTPFFLPPFFHRASSLSSSSSNRFCKKPRRSIAITGEIIRARVSKAFRTACFRFNVG